jgi:hypothetical protein
MRGMAVSRELPTETLERTKPNSFQTVPQVESSPSEKKDHQFIKHIKKVIGTLLLGHMPFDPHFRPKNPSQLDTANNKADHQFSQVKSQQETRQYIATLFQPETPKL